MKTRIFLFIGILLINYSNVISKELISNNIPVKKDNITIFTSPDLYPLTAKWVNEYKKINPALEMEVIKSEDKDIAGILKNGTGIGFITDEPSGAVNLLTAWNMVVGRDVIVPVMNAANPFRDEIYKTGVTTAGLARIFDTPEKQNWGMLLGNSKNSHELPIHIYVINDPMVISGLGNFVNTKKLKFEGIKVNNEKEMISAIQNDPNAIGFCKLVQVVNLNNQSIADNIQLVPIDRNGNGKIDYMEAIYNNFQDFSRGVWIGKYPKVLSGKIYSISKAKPKNEAELAFLNWILSDGQQILSASGYSDLVLSERQTQLDKINEPANYTNAPASSLSLILIILLILFTLLAAGFIMDKLVERRRERRLSGNKTAARIQPVFDGKTTTIPKGIYFDNTHTWAFMKKDGKVKIGIDDFLLHITGPITRIELKNTGDKIKKGDHIITLIQKGKQLNIYSPVTGTITTQNKNLLIDTTLLNNSPFTDGWIYTVEPTNWSLELQFLYMAEKYTDWLKTEYSRLKDFFSIVVRIHAPAFAMVLQDGGILRDGILAELDPEVWEDFQTKFIDISK